MARPVFLTCQLVFGLVFAVFFGSLCAPTHAAQTNLLLRANFNDYPNPYPKPPLPWEAEGYAYINSWQLWAETATPYMFFEPWMELDSRFDPWFGQIVSFQKVDGPTFTLSFRARFESSFQADKTFIFFQDVSDTNNPVTVYTNDITQLVNARRGSSWYSYTSAYSVPANIMSNLCPNNTNGKIKVVVQSIQHLHVSSSGAAFFDDLVLAQSNPPILPKLEASCNSSLIFNSTTNTLVSPLIGKTNRYTLAFKNSSGTNLFVSSVGLSGSQFTLIGNTSNITIPPYESASLVLQAVPSNNSPLTTTLSVLNNDPTSSSFNVALTTLPLVLSNDFNSGSPATLGFTSQASSKVAINSIPFLTLSNGALFFNSKGTDYPWTNTLSQTFISPGSLDPAGTKLNIRLRASGSPAIWSNRISLRLESLNEAQLVTGKAEFGYKTNETWTGQTNGIARFALDFPNDTTFRELGGALSSAGTNTLDLNAPYYRIAIDMTHLNFNKTVQTYCEIDSLSLDFVEKPFLLSNGSFESGLYSVPTDPTTVENYWTGVNVQDWLKSPTEGVKKAIISNGDKLYNQLTGLLDPDVSHQAFSGTKAFKIYGQNYYILDPGSANYVWQGPKQTGIVYQEFLVSGSSLLAQGASIHARGMAKVYSIDPLTGGSTFNYGFKFMNSVNSEISRAVTTLTASNTTADKWVALTANATIPAGTAKVQLVCEFVQNAASDKGSVYLDDLSVGYGAINETVTVGSSTYSLVWSDEFDGSSLNSANWTPETGGGGWGNNEVQTYTATSANLRVDNGSLILKAVKSGSAWTSARIKSQGQRSFKYGKIEFRAKLPSGIGPWPAAWMLGENISTAGWPACGEIDVMEWRGGFNGVATSDANTVGHALHSPSRYGGDPLETARSAVTNPSTAFHTYAVLWESNKVTFSVDGVDKSYVNPVDQPVFQKEFFLILNLAMGGAYVGNTIDSTMTSATYELDYVRVYQDPAASTPAPSAPTTPTFSSISSTGFTINWASVSGATSYKLDVSSSSSFTSYVTQDLTVSGTSQAVTSLNPGTTYHARVRAVNSGGTSASSSNGTQATLTSYQQYLSGLGYLTNTAFNADANGDGVKEGIKYAFNAASPQLNSAPATITRSGNTLTYTFDIRNDSALTVVAQLSTNLTSWTDQASSVITNGTGAPIGYIRKIVTITTTEPKTFIRLQVSN